MITLILRLASRPIAKTDRRKRSVSFMSLVSDYERENFLILSKYVSDQPALKLRQTLYMHDISFLYEDATRFRQHFGLSILPHFNTHFIVISHATRGKRLDFKRFHILLAFTFPCFSHSLAKLRSIFIAFSYTFCLAICGRIFPGVVKLCLLDHFFFCSFCSVY